MKDKRSKGILTFIGIVSLILLMITAVLTGACAKPEPAPAPAPAPAPTPAPAPAPEPVKPITLVFTSHEMPNTFWVKGIFEPWFAELEERTEGRVKIEPHWAGELINIMDAYDAATKGTVDMAHFIPSMVTGRFPMDEIATFSTYDKICWRVSRVYWELHQNFPEIGAQYNDTKLLSVTQIFQRGLGTSTKPIHKLEDMKGIKMLSSGKWAGARMEALGMAPVSVPPGEATMSVERGIIDGSPIPIYLLEDWKLGEVIKYVSLVVNSTPLFGVTVNLDTFNSLPPDIQQIMLEMGEYLVDLLDDVQYQVDRERYDRAIELFGIEFIEIPKEELARWVEADQPVINAFVAELEDKGLPGTQLKEEFQKLEAKYAAEEYYPW